jgi:mRNA interferase RelE/StbE
MISAYTIKFEQNAIKALTLIPMPYKEQIKKAVYHKLALDPVRIGKPLRHALSGFRRLRLGGWRIIYRINGNVVEIVKIGHRKDVYDC